MKCPKCENPYTAVFSTISMAAGEVKRMRCCKRCWYQFGTTENYVKERKILRFADRDGLMPGGMRKKRKIKMKKKNLSKKEWQLASAAKEKKQKEQERNIRLYKKAMGIRTEKPKEAQKEEPCVQ